MDEKSDRLQLVQLKLIEILDFLSNYLPLVNCHSNDFILNNHWDTFLSESIRKELESFSTSELVSFVSHTLNNEKSNQQETYSADGSDPGLWKFKCEYLEKARIGSEISEIYSSEMQKFPPNWVHGNLYSFLHDAQKHSLQKLGILSQIKNLFEDVNDMNQNSVFISTFMNQKKTHEVEVMGDLCFKLTQEYDTKVVMDLGSGKGYLSTHLAFQHKLCVIGVDAQNINTKGATKRADILSRQWEGITRNEVLRADKVEPGKLGKKKKKLMKKLDVEKDIQQQKDFKKSDDLHCGISDELLTDFSHLFENSGKICDGNMCGDGKAILTGDSSDLTEKFQNSINITENSNEDVGKGKRSKSHIKIKTDIEFVDCDDISNSSNIPVKKKNTKSSTLKANHFPVTMYIHTDSNLSDIVGKTLTQYSAHTEGKGTSSKDFCGISSAKQSISDMIEVCSDTDCSDDQKWSEKNSLMLTGLHTCGGLGSNILRLFVKSEDAKVLCNVACCYHLMSEEFVASPFKEKEDMIEAPGFPLSDFLRRNKVGIGRQARNLASQSINRRAQDEEVLAKQFPRMLLQVILRDQLGYVRSDWKGLRKLDQKCKGMYEYVTKAFIKLGVPTEGITEELIDYYCEKYKDQKRKFAAFFQLKTVLAPCIEAVILLDRLCFLLEQESVKDAKLLQLFDPVTSPRCYGIVSVKA
ncbi:probable methyltransferase-like protein 25 [Saccostrea echinata]|uniref:probable methyltransferase-like protein 25 n=1 Tax=Saccostrea echinata TaxID=191078 RepID=UPI002A7EDBD6|nr:probable methyltransferase-like protein 25 [Saccostrea echinata]